MGDRSSDSHHSCDICGRSFTRNWLLQRHVARVHFGKTKAIAPYLQEAINRAQAHEEGSSHQLFAPAVGEDDVYDTADPLQHEEPEGCRTGNKVALFPFG